MSEVINFFGKDNRETFKEKAKSKFQEGIAWANDNMEIIVTVVPLVIGGTTAIVKAVGKQTSQRKSEELKNLYCYDRSLGHYWRLKRELSNKEWLDIDKRKKNGERLADILAELKVLK